MPANIPSWVDAPQNESLQTQLVSRLLACCFEPWVVEMILTETESNPGLRRSIDSYIATEDPPPALTTTWTPDGGTKPEEIDAWARAYFAVTNHAMMKMWSTEDIKAVLKPLVYGDEKMEAVLQTIPIGYGAGLDNVIKDMSSGLRWGNVASQTAWKQQNLFKLWAAQSKVISINTPETMIWMGRALRSVAETARRTIGAYEQLAPSLAAQAGKLTSFSDEMDAAGFGGPPNLEAAMELLRDWGSTPEEGLRNLAAAAYGQGTADYGAGGPDEDDYEYDSPDYSWGGNQGMGGPGMGGRKRKWKKGWFKRGLKRAGKKLKAFAKKAFKWLEPIGDAILGIIPGAASAKAAIKAGVQVAKGIAASIKKKKARGGPLIIQSTRQQGVPSANIPVNARDIASRSTGIYGDNQNE